MDDGAGLVPPRPARGGPRRAAGRPRARPRRPGLLPRRPAAARPPRLRAADPVPARVPARPRRRAARARQRPGGAPRRARARAAGAGARGRARPRSTAPPTSGRSRAGATSGWRGAGARSSSWRIPGSTRSTTSRIRTQRDGRTRSSRPFHRTWLEVPRRDVLRRPAQAPAAAARCAKGRVPSLAALGLEQEVDRPAAGRRARGARAARRASWPAASHATPRTTTSSAGTGRRGCRPTCTSAACRRARSRSGCRRGEGAEAFRRQLCWRDFYRHVLAPPPAQRALGVPGALPRRDPLEPRAASAFEAWCEGRTGFPLVDAGMRQLRREGWMHNRARLVVGSFLTKDLGIDWRWGERWFMRLADRRRRGQQQRQLAVDRLGRRRSAAGVPAHLQPGAPQERYDPDGDYVRRYVPELRAVPDEYLAEPWTMPAEVQRECGCVIGERLPGADRRPRPGPARGARALPALMGRAQRVRERPAARRRTARRRSGRSRPSVSAGPRPAAARRRRRPA